MGEVAAEAFNVSLSYESAATNTTGREGSLPIAASDSMDHGLPHSFCWQQGPQILTWPLAETDHRSLSRRQSRKRAVLHLQYLLVAQRQGDYAFGQCVGERNYASSRPLHSILPLVGACHSAGTRVMTTMFAANREYSLLKQGKYQPQQQLCSVGSDRMRQALSFPVAYYVTHRCHHISSSTCPHCHSVLPSFFPINLSFLHARNISVISVFNDSNFMDPAYIFYITNRSHIFLNQQRTLRQSPRMHIYITV